MLARLFARWRVRLDAPASGIAPQSSTDGQEATAPISAAPPPADAATHASTEAPTSVSAWHLLARRPAIDAHGAIAGWELRLSDWATQRLLRSSAQRTMQETYGYALIQAARAATVGGRRPLVSLVGIDDPAPVLAALPTGTILLMGDGSGNPLGRLAEHVHQLHRAGIQVAAPPQLQADLCSDFALLDAARLGSAEVLRRCRQPAPAEGGWIAINLASSEEMAEAVRHRATLAFGRLVQARPQATRRSLAPPIAAAQVAAILSALVNGRPPREMAEMFKGDVTLSYRLLRYLSTVGVGQGRRPQSIQEAVILLGSDELHRWLCVLLADSGSSPLARALHETALTRGRLLELMAHARGEPSPEALFVLGAFSLLDLLLDVPLETALALAPLPDAVIDALIAEAGPWRPYLDVALALEACDPARLDEACTRLQMTRDDAVALNEKAAQWSTEAALLFQEPDAKASVHRAIAVVT